MLINCVAYEKGKKIADTPVSDIREGLLSPVCDVLMQPGQR